MLHRYVKQSQQYINGKARSLAARASLRLHFRGSLWKRRTLLWKLVSHGGQKLWIRKGHLCSRKNSGVKSKNEQAPETGSRPWRSPQVIPGKTCTTVGKYELGVVPSLEESNSEDSAAVDGATSLSQCRGLQTALGSLPAQALVTCGDITPLRGSGLLMDSTQPLPVPAEDGQSADGSTTQQHPWKPTKASNKLKNRAPLQFMQCKRLYKFNTQLQYGVRRSLLGCRRKEWKVRHLTRVSTLGVKRRRAEVHSLSSESTCLSREVNGWQKLKGKRRWRCERTCVRRTEDGSIPEVQEPGCEGFIGPACSPESRDYCGPGHVDALEPESWQSRQDSSLKGAELASHAVPAWVGDSDGPGGAPVEDGASMEAEAVVSHSDSCTSPLRDHRYCKTTGGLECTARQRPEVKEEEEAEDLRPPTHVSRGVITEFIHEFLENFYGKYGSFFPLSRSDVLKHLKKKLNTDLTDRKSFICAEVGKYQAGLAAVPTRFFKVSYNKHTLTLDDLSTLEDQNWVNDQVINMYGELIMDAVQHKVHFFNSFFHRQLVTKGYEGVKRWTKKVDLFSKRLLLVPIHLEIHWCLITVDMASQSVRFYDSQGLTFKHAVENILRYIMTEAEEKKCPVFQKGWKTIVNKRIPQQKNDNDCGVFVLEYCKCLALERPLQFAQANMPKIRKRIYMELCECKLTDG